MWVDARPEMRRAVEAGAVDRTRLPCNLSCVMRDAAIVCVCDEFIECERESRCVWGLFDSIGDRLDVAER